MMDSQTLYARIKELPPKSQIRDQVEKEGLKIHLHKPSQSDWRLFSSEVEAVLEKMDYLGVSLGRIYGEKIKRGVVTGYNPAFLIASEIIQPFVAGDEVRWYSINWSGRYLIFTRRGIDIRKYPSVLEHLSNWRPQLEPKENSKQKIGRKPGQYEWFEIQDSTSYFKDFGRPKIVYGQFQIAPHFAISLDTLYFGSNHYMIVPDQKEDLFYLCGVLNSRIYFFYMKQVAGVLGDVDMRGRLISQKSHILKFPVINTSNVNGKSRHDQIFDLVKRMLDLNKQLQSAKTAHDKATLLRQVDATDRHIDRLVYELCELTPEEIKIVEESASA